VPKPPPPGHPFWRVFGVVTRANVLLLRASRGRLGGRMGRMGILVLHHVGRRSGKRRETPLNFLEDGGRLVVIASKGGVDAHPAWFHNLVAHPEAEAELPGGERRAVRARVASGEERERLWSLAVAAYRPYADYQSHTEREIPVVVLEPRAD
jgi:F420H(2)-dependent quinone reductase